jgi:broad specificity phosphatase PhoE
MQRENHSTFYLIRHASTDVIGHTLAGRQPGVHLNEAGRLETARLAQSLARKRIAHLVCSPLERARETAAPLALQLGLEPQISEALNEIDFGDWTGGTIAELESVEAWKQWNVFRSGNRIPNGETMLEVQSRMVAEIERLRCQFTGQAVALVSHGDPLRAALVYFLGAALEHVQRIEVSPASVSVLTISDWGAQVRCMNVPPGADPPVL